MRILVALIAVFMVSGAVAQKKPTTTSFGGKDFVMCNGAKAGSTWSCKDPKTGKNQKVQCQTPAKQKLPPKLSMAELDEICGIQTGDGFDTYQRLERVPVTL